MPDSKTGSIAFLIALILPIISMLAYANHQGRVVRIVEASVEATPTPAPITNKAGVESSPTEARIVTITTPTPENNEQEEIEAYIKTIFGSEWRVARAVHYNECGPTNKGYPRNCSLKSSVEHSVGIFQINIQSKSTKVHWSRIPGTTLEEKVEWLNDPYNNTLMAYWIYSKSDWHPWTAYTSGNYLNDL